MKALYEVALADLQRGVRLMVLVQDDIDPQFRIATPEGDIAVAVTFPEGMDARRGIFVLLGKLCAWKQALAYTMTFNVAEPNALMTIAVGGAEVVGCFVRIEGEAGDYREELFGQPTWVSAEDIGDEFCGLLPGRSGTLSFDDLRDLELWFGVDGRFPAIYVATGKPCL